MQTTHLFVVLGFLATGCGGKAAPAEIPVETPVEEITPAPEEDVPATIGEVVAIEIEADDADRRYTRDPDSVRAVLDAMGAPSDWRRSGMPLCKPTLWARLVPPSGEGGASFQFCGATSPGHVWIAGAGAYVLTEEASAALHAVASGLELPETGSIPPVAVTDNLGSFLLTATIDPGDGAAQGLRSVSLSHGHHLEPDATWADGSPVSQSVELTEEQAMQLAGTLALSGFFARAKKFHSAAVEDPGDAPQDSTEGMPEPLAAPTGWVQLTVTVGGWHQTWHEGNKATAIFEHSLDAVKRAGISDEATTGLDELAAQLK